MARETKEILTSAEDTLSSAKIGLAMFSDPKLRRIAIRNVVVFGRAFTNVLQNLRSTEAKFDGWYDAYVTQMRSDPLMRYFYELRSIILKQGRLPIGNRMRFSGNPHALMARFPRPPNATGFFIGDVNGGSGWTVALPDGRTEALYVDLPSTSSDHALELSLILPEAPPEISHVDIKQLAERYIEYFQLMLDHAKREFIPHSA